MSFASGFGAGSLQALSTQSAASRLQTALESDNAATAAQLASQIAALQRTVDASTAARITADVSDAADLRAQLQDVLDAIGALSATQLALQATQTATDAVVTSAAAAADAAQRPMGVAVVRLGQTGVGSLIGDQTVVIPIAGVRRLDGGVFQNGVGDPFVAVTVAGWYSVYAEVNVEGSDQGLRDNDGFVTVQVGTSPNPGVTPYTFSSSFKGTSPGGAADTSASAYFNCFIPSRTGTTAIAQGIVRNSRASIRTIMYLDAGNAVQLELTTRPDRTSDDPGDVQPDSVVQSFMHITQLSDPVT
jgi:hypothetical protein